MLVGEKLHTCVINGVLQWWGVREWPDKGLLYSTPGHQGMGISGGEGKEHKLLDSHTKNKPQRKLI